MNLIWIVIVACCLVACSGGVQSQHDGVLPANELPNPASVKCVTDGHRLEIRTGEGGGQIGICINAAGKECEEWKYFREECQL